MKEEKKELSARDKIYGITAARERREAQAKNINKKSKDNSEDEE